MFVSAMEKGSEVSKLVSFHKYHGAGNDFIVVDNTKASYDFICTSPNRIREICNRRFGVGADGFISISKHSEYDFQMKYFNCDGHEGTLCGNGARCSVAFARQLGMLQYNEARFLAFDGPHYAIFDEIHSLVHVKMNNKVEVVQYDNGDCFIDNGSPHLVRMVAEPLQEIDVEKLGKELCHNHQCVKDPRGVNVHFVQVDKSGNALWIRTYEWGVYGETFACGTGAVAAALVLAVRVGQSTKSKKCTECDWDALHMHVRAKGGDLAVSYETDPKGGFSEVCLVGPVENVFSGTYTFKE